MQLEPGHLVVHQRGFGPPLEGESQGLKRKSNIYNNQHGYRTTEQVRENGKCTYQVTYAQTAAANDSNSEGSEDFQEFEGSAESPKFRKGRDTHSWHL